MAYFLKFKLERGHYAFAGREDYEGHSVYKIEYYPSRLFADESKKADDASQGPAPPAPDADRPAKPKDEGTKKTEDDLDARIERQMNKVALVTLWIEPEQKQILRYTFENVGMDFLPGRWLVRVDDLQASMRMVQAFPGVWLPGGIDGEGSITLASGTFTFRYRTAYSDYREATVKARIR